MKIVNQDLWLGMSSASNGTKSFAHKMLDFTILCFPDLVRIKQFEKDYNKKVYSIT